MTNAKNTKHALLSSILALFLCFAMLLGTTFAWFTDSVTSANNIIKSGNLDIELEYWNGTDWTDVKGASDILTNELWEPGVTEVAYLRVANAGTLALKYQLGISILNEIEGKNKENETFKLSDYIMFGVVENVNGETGAYSTDAAGRAAAIAAVTDAKKISAGYSKASSMNSKDEIYLALVLYMPTDIGDVANHNGTDIPQIDLGINVFATQMTAESDSFDDQYDAAAPYFLPAGTTEADFGANVACVNGQYYATLNAALTAIHNSGAEESVLYLKPNADLGSVNHAHVCSSITVYGNDAYISGGERDFEIGVPGSTGMSCTIDSPVNLTVYDLNGCAVWGAVPENATVNITLSGCEDVSKVILPNYTTGNYNLSLTISDCTFTGTDTYRDSAIWCRGLDSLTVTNTKFTDYAVGINQNNKDGVENYTLTNCTFVDCATASNIAANKEAIGNDTSSYAAPVRVVASVDGTVTNLTISGCEFIYSGSEASINGDILMNGDDDAGTVNAVIDEAKKIVYTTAALIDAIKNAPVGETTVIYLADMTYNGDIAITVAALGKSGGDVVIKAMEGATPVISGTVTLGYRNQGVGATMYDANVTFEGVTFDHTSATAHSLDIQDVKSLTLKNCTIISSGEYGIGCARGNGTGTSKIVGCTFENAGMQLLGNFATGLVIDDCTFNNSCINVQAGNGVTVQNCEFNSTLTDANIGESFYLIRSNSTPITVKNCEINIDSTLKDVATAQAKWGIFWNRGTTNWTVSNVTVSLTEAAQAQTELLVNKCSSTGVINYEN